MHGHVDISATEAKGCPIMTRRIDPSQDQGRKLTQISNRGQPAATPTSSVAAPKAGDGRPHHFQKIGPYPQPPRLGGGIRPSEWLFQLRNIEMKRGAPERAREAQAIGDWLVALAGWINGKKYKVRRRRGPVGKKAA